jgi:hypothetical protein
MESMVVLWVSTRDLTNGSTEEIQALCCRFFLVWPRLVWLAILFQAPTSSYMCCRLIHYCVSLASHLSLITLVLVLRVHNHSREPSAFCPAITLQGL